MSISPIHRRSVVVRRSGSRSSSLDTTRRLTASHDVVSRVVLCVRAASWRCRATPANAETHSSAASNVVFFNPGLARCTSDR